MLHGVGIIERAAESRTSGGYGGGGGGSNDHLLMETLEGGGGCIVKGRAGPDVEISFFEANHEDTRSFGAVVSTPNNPQLLWHKVIAYTKK